MDLGIAQKSAIVTGGSQGIGKAIALALSREQVYVTICARHLEILQETAKEIQEQTGVEVLAVQGDVTNIDDVRNVVSSAAEHFGHVDILVNNAVTEGNNASFFDLLDDDWYQRYDVKMLGGVRFVREVAPHMKVRGWGRIINIGGGAARTPGDFGWTGGPIHAGIGNLSKRLADLLGPDGITVNTVDPGRVWTEGRTITIAGPDGPKLVSRAEHREEELQQAAKKRGITREEMEDIALSEIPIGRRMKAEDSANLITFLSSDLASAITGQVLVIDGGKTKSVYY